MSEVEVTKSSATFSNYPDLASNVVGGAIIFATDDWFAVAENLLKPEQPEFKDGLFTDCGKWMDGWETRRKRIAGHDWCIIQLGCPGRVHGIEVSTRHFTGNYPPKCSVQGITLPNTLTPRSGERMGSCASQEEFDEITKLQSENWMELVPMQKLKPGYEDTHTSLFRVDYKERITHIRLNIFPDGGIARLRVHGEVQPDWTQVPETKILDLVAMVNGGMCLDYSNAHYGQASNVIAPGRAKKMDEGWETARRLSRPEILTDDFSHGGEWARYRLGHPGQVRNVEIDTNHFKGNYPHSFTLEGAFIGGLGEKVASGDELDSADWKMIVSGQTLTAHYQHSIEDGMINDVGKVTYVRLTIYPDGGVSRMILLGHIIKD